MDIQEALKIMRALANGTNPENGEALEESSVCRRPQTVRALNRAISALVAEQGRETKRPCNAFRTWTRAEDAQVCEELRKGMDFRVRRKLRGRDRRRGRLKQGLWIYWQSFELRCERWLEISCGRRSLCSASSLAWAR